MDNAELQEVTKGLSEKQKEKVERSFKGMAERLKRRGKDMREVARGRGLVFSTIIEAAGGAASEVVRRKVIGRYTKTSTMQGAGLIVVGIAVKAAGKYVKIPLLHEIGGAHVAQGAAVASMKSFYGEDDPMVIAIEGTAQSAKKDDEG